MTRYLLNAPVVTSFGRYDLSGPLIIDHVRQCLRQGFDSAIGHASTAELVSQLVGIEVPARRQAIDMQPGDDAIVFRLLKRLPEGVVLDIQRLRSVPHEFALLKRVV